MSLAHGIYPICRKVWELAKADELHISKRSFQRWSADTRRTAKPVFCRAEPRKRQELAGISNCSLRVALDIMREQIDKSRPTRNFVIEHAEVRLIGTYGAGAVPMPSKSKAYEIWMSSTPCARCSLRAQKRNRDIAARPVMPYGKLHPSRPESTC